MVVPESAIVKFLFLMVIRVGCVILLWHSLGLPCHYFANNKEIHTSNSGHIRSHNTELVALECLKNIPLTYFRKVVSLISLGCF